MNLKIASAGAILIIVTATGCATKSELAREQHVEELRRSAVLADEQREERQEAQYRQAAREAARERKVKTTP